MASYLKPRRGAYSAISATTLQSGEIFFETPNGVGGGKGRIMMGNGSNTYSALASSSKYFLDLDSTPVAYTNITASDSTATNTFSNLAGSLGSGTVTLPTLVRVLKRALYNMSAVYERLKSNIDFLATNVSATDITRTIHIGFSWNTGYGRCKAFCIESCHLVCITFAVKRTGVPYDNSTYYTFFTIPDTYAPTADVFFKGCAEGMVITYSGKVTKYGEVMGYNADNTNNGARLGSTNTGSVVYYCN